jgi:AmpE protein
MAKILIAIVIVLVGTHSLPELARWRDLGWLRERFSLQASNGTSYAPWLLIAAILITGLIQILLREHAFGLLELAFMILVLFLCWGPGDLDADIARVLKASDSDRRAAAAQSLHSSISAEPVTYHAGSLVEASFAAALSRQFGVLFWFVVLGPVGAVGYRLVHLLARSPAFEDVAGSARSGFERIAQWLDWAPAHLMALSLGLVSDFDATISAWRDYHAAHGEGYFTTDIGFLAVIARASVDADIAAGDGGIVGEGDPLAALADARRVLRRVLFVWLGIVAIIVLGGWAG